MEGKLAARLRPCAVYRLAAHREIPLFGWSAVCVRDARRFWKQDFRSTPRANTIGVRTVLENTAHAYNQPEHPSHR